MVMSLEPIWDHEFLEGKDHSCLIYCAQNILPMYGSIIQK